MDEPDVRKLVEELLFQVLKARTLCLRLRQKLTEAADDRHLDDMSEMEQQQLLDHLVVQAPMPPALTALKPGETARYAALRFVAEGMQFLTQNTAAFNPKESVPSVKLMEIEQQLDMLAAHVVEFKDNFSGDAL